MSNKKLPQDVVDHWPEVFKDVSIEVVPIKYLHTIRIYFADGKIWDIDVNKTLKKTNKSDDSTLEKAIEELLIEYEDAIVNVDFRLDTQQIKNDIQKRTTSFMKKRK